MNLNFLKTVFNVGETASGGFVATGLLTITRPLIRNLILSKAVPAIKRFMYQKADKVIDKVLNDLAQNASKIKDEQNETKKLAYIEGSRLGLEMIKAIAEKILKAANVIEGMF